MEYSFGELSLENQSLQLPLLNLTNNGFPIRLNSLPEKIAAVFQRKPAYSVNPGDIILDLDAGYGETTLYFLHQLGAAGMVYSFESDPQQLAILRHNMILNPQFLPHSRVVDDTCSLDEWVLQNTIQKIDFIKLNVKDINQVKALIDVIKRFRPKLAFHCSSHPQTISHYLKARRLRYEFSIDGHTLFAEPHVLRPSKIKITYAKIKSKMKKVIKKLIG